MGFVEDVIKAARRNRSWLCVGLDPDLAQFPLHLARQDSAEAIVGFNKEIVESTADLVCAYKPNSAFYEALGPRGLEALLETRKLIPKEIPVILDAKRGDIDSTARKYAEAVFDVYQADAVTLSPYLGFDSLEPFLRYSSKGLFVLCRTSNQSARDFQDLNCNGRPLFEAVAQQIRAWSSKLDTAQIGAVVGATYPVELSRARAILGDELLILVPGLGKQQGDLAQAVSAGMNREGERAVFNASRSILYASDNADFADAARQEAIRLRDAINRCVLAGPH